MFCVLLLVCNDFSHFVMWDIHVTCQEVTSAMPGLLFCTLQIMKYKLFSRVLFLILFSSSVASPIAPALIPLPPPPPLPGGEVWSRLRSIEAENRHKYVGQKWKSKQCKPCRSFYSGYEEPRVTSPTTPLLPLSYTSSLTTWPLLLSVWTSSPSSLPRNCVLMHCGPTEGFFGFCNTRVFSGNPQHTYAHIHTNTHTLAHVHMYRQI